MTPRFILITTAAILIAACNRPSAEADAGKTAELAQQRQTELTADEKIRQLEERLNAADQQKAADREAELERLKEELAQSKKEKEQAAERIRELQNEANKPAPAPAPIAEAPTAEREATAIRADLERVVEEEDLRQEREPVYVGRAVPETQRVAKVEAFYEPLDEYGDWIETDDFGYVFRPQVASRRDWRPYTDGRWIHTDYGWTWQSNEDFGWATYHYGRWTRISGSGWVWVPGREWGPGWVSWRRGSEHCGWAPLPPESRTRVSFTTTVDRDYDIGPAAYVFVALANFGARSYAPVLERPERNVTIINKTVNITNITYNNTTNNTVVYNGGPSYDLVRARSRQPVENVNVNFAQRTQNVDRRKIVNVRQGDNFQIAAPPVPVAPIVAPARVKERLGRVKHDKGWEGVDPAQARKVHQNIAATSTERPRRQRPAAGIVNPATPNPANVPPNAPGRPQRPAPATPEPVRQPPVDPAKPPQTAPTPDAPAKPSVAPTPEPHDPGAAQPRPGAGRPPKPATPEEPKKPADTAPPKSVPDPVPPRPAPGVAPKLDQPETPAKPVAPQPPKVREQGASRPKPARPEESKKPADATPPKSVPDPVPPQPKPDVTPKVDKPDAPVKPSAPEPPKVRESGSVPPRSAPGSERKLDRPEVPKKDAAGEPRRVRPVEKPTPPQPARVPQRRPDAAAVPAVTEKPQAPVQAAPPARPRPEAPARVKPPAPAPNREKPTPAPQPAAARKPQVERRPAPPVVERTAPVSRPVVQAPPQPARKVAQPQRPPQPVQKAPAAQVARTAPPPQVQRAPAVQRPPAPVAQRAPQPETPKPEKAAEESDKRKKKKEDG